MTNLASDLECGFFAVNGKHCVIGDHCVVCRAPAPRELTKGEEITFSGFGEALDNYTWRIVGVFDGAIKLELVK
jgi:hypothetical protein